MRRAALIGLAAALGACGTATARPVNSGLLGRVVAGPVCPVVSVPPNPSCAARPLAVELRVRAVGRGAGSVIVHSGVDGRFRVRLPRGTYLVQALGRTGSPFPRPPADRRIRVHSGRFTSIIVEYDTGIR